MKYGRKKHQHNCYLHTAGWFKIIVCNLQGLKSVVTGYLYRVLCVRNPFILGNKRDNLTLPMQWLIAPCNGRYLRGKTSIWFLTVQWVKIILNQRLGSNAGSQEDRQVSHQRWIWGIHYIQATKYASKVSTLTLKPKADVTKSATQGYKWAHKKDLYPPKIQKYCLESWSLKQM